MLFTKHNPLCSHVLCQTTNFMLPSFFPGRGFEAIIQAYQFIFFNEQGTNQHSIAEHTHTQTLKRSLLLSCL